MLLLGQFGDLVDIVVGKERILLPVGVAKAEGNVVGERVVSQEQLEVGVERAMVEIVRALPSQHVLRTLREQSFESHVGHDLSDLVLVDEARVAEDLRFLSEILLDLLRLQLHLVAEDLLVLERGETVRVGLGQKLHAARLVELLQFVEHLWRMELQLLHTHARERERHLEVVAMLLDHLPDRVERGHVASVHDIGYASLVLVVVVVVVVGSDVEEAVALEVYDLMYLEI